MAKNKVESDEQLVYDVPELSKVLLISESHTYKVLRQGLVPSIRLGRRILIPKVALDKILACEDQIAMT